ncbi:MAG TPA: 30S ribosomal protein S6 [Planctomycetaceae bacterium]|nr:30S ribosomal protein S6 [Pirellulales bacterium]HAL13427.1 30S ribosomal protein S6 [Planctomycetaceae bacterium]HCK70839.1 30S ribosomal protein S6 [Planctomycetaceae bacterium]
MASNVYECLFILDSNRYARDPQAVAQGISDMVTNNDGEILVTRLWNEQKLAYPINGNRKGTYWLTYFSMEGTSLTAFERSCRLNDNVMRNLTIKIDPRLVDTLVSHAKGIATAAEEAESTEKPAADDAASDTADAPTAEVAATDSAEPAESSTEE